jgi:hypothetical protein
MGLVVPGEKPYVVRFAFTTSTGAIEDSPRSDWAKISSVLLFGSMGAQDKAPVTHPQHAWFA